MEEQTPKDAKGIESAISSSDDEPENEGIGQLESIAENEPEIKQEMVMPQFPVNFGASTSRSSEPQPTIEQTKHAITEETYAWGGNTGAFGNRFEQDLAYALFVRSSLAANNFRLATEMAAAEAFDDVVIVADDLKETWLVQCKKALNEKAITSEELFPDKKDLKGKDFDLYKYLRSYSRVEQTLNTKGYRKKFYLFTNRSLDESKELLEWVDIVPRNVNKRMYFPNSEAEARYVGFKPIKEKIEVMIENANMELNDIRSAIIRLFEDGKVEQVLSKYRKSLSTILKVCDNHVQFHESFPDNNKDASHNWLHNELQKHFKKKEKDMKSLRKELLNHQAKTLLKGKSEMQHLPPIIDRRNLEEFFEDLTFCINQPSDLRTIVDRDLRTWLKSWVRPEVLGNLSEAHSMLPRVKFDEVFKEWIEQSMRKGDEKSFLSAKEGRNCIQDIEKELKYFLSKFSEPLDRYYINRKMEVRDNQNLSDHDFVQQLENDNNCSILLAKPGMGKTWLLKHIGFEVQRRFGKDVFYIDLKRLTKKLNSANDTDVNISYMLTDVLSERSQNILQRNLDSNENRTLLLVDGLDEINSIQMRNAISFMKKLLESNKVQIIMTGRQNVEKSLKRDLDINPKVVHVTPFDDNDQMEFLERFWKSIDQDANDDWENKRVKFERFANLLLDKVKCQLKIPQNDFSGNPLMLRMLAEIYRENFFDFLSSENDDALELFLTEEISVLKLFDKIAEKSFNVKMNSIHGQDSYAEIEPFNDELEPQFENYVREHQLMALKQLEVEELQSVIDEDGHVARCIARLCRRIENGSERSLLINFTNELNEVEFIHSSFAEYFTARYLFDNVNACSGTLFQILKKYPGAQRFFFWMIEARGNDEHSDVLINLLNTHSDVAFWVCEANCFALLKKILENTNNHNLQTEVHSYYGSLLHVAISIGSSEIVAYLVQNYKMNANIYYEHDGTPLHLASIRGHLPIVGVLINHSADVNAQDANAMTPLHFAVENGHSGIVQMLIDASAILESRNTFGHTPLDLAIANGYLEIAQMLRTHIELNKKDNK